MDCRGGQQKDYYEAKARCYLNTVGDVVVVALVVRTHSGVCKVVHREVECRDRDPMEAVLACLGEGQRPTEVSREKLD